MKCITFSAVAAAALLQTAAAAGKCGDQSCGKKTPCCVRGYCNANAMYCMPMNCEPQNSYSANSCWDTPHCVSSKVDFGGGDAFAQISDYNGDPSSAAFVSQFEPSNAKIGGGRLQMELVKQSDGKGFGATVTNTRAIQYGTVSAVMRSGGNSGGVVSSFIIRNDKLGDEIDFEFVGHETSSVQSNYYWHDHLDYTKMVKSPSLSDTSQNDHTYQIQWTPDQIVWSVDGNEFRVVKRSETWDAAENTFKYPDSEAYISFSIWDGGSGAQGTSEWAGGAIQWGQGPFIANVKSVEIDCFYKGNETTYTPPGDSDDHSTSSGKDDDDDKDSDDEKSASEKDKSDDDDEDKSSDDDEDKSSDDNSSSASDKDSADENAGKDEPSDDKDETDDVNTGSAATMLVSLGTTVAALLMAYAF
ncbi:concanavalin A-like lectin/glucanase [Coemansia reversa NRRL 1564]|uniref:Concanavalin A-like lectin/glucanase n=1 Tax=Coemansia reversa (strain ATCC 12441 / NRRL 1564) TaxID=763665 RepID=A0A2G5BF29_COERN|nr:concanavalin A-like lectin/glucanase [Coemansia reversa NRRL 1564]|eukprot:PIA17592.1 concanavalin A-like lectin/glucanase [Coemansia reversa NRRL 1564]